MSKIEGLVAWSGNWSNDLLPLTPCLSTPADYNHIFSQSCSGKTCLRILGPDTALAFVCLITVSFMFWEKLLDQILVVLSHLETNDIRIRMIFCKTNIFILVWYFQTEYIHIPNSHNSVDIFKLNVFIFILGLNLFNRIYSYLYSFDIFKQKVFVFG